MTGPAPGENENPTDGGQAVAADLAVRRLEVAARYIYANILPLPLVVIGLAALLGMWHSAAVIVPWAAVTIASWCATLLTFHRFLQDENRAQHLTRWTIAACLAVFVASIAIASVAPLFWVEGDRTNNVLLYVVVAAGLAGAGTQSAPSLPVVVSNIAPYAVVFVSLSLSHESYPANIGFAFLQICYIGLIALTAKAVWQLSDDMLHLRAEKRTLIDKLQLALVETTAARTKAETASRTKSEFLANMSHELRTPLNAVLGFSEIIKDRAFGDAALDRYAEYGQHIHASGKHLLGLIGDILDLSKIEAGKRELDESPVDLREQASDALRFVALHAEKKRLNLELDAPENIVLRADERAIRQIMVNLLSNAVKFTPENGSVWLMLARSADGGATIVVRDTGVGINQDELEKVLERFGQGRHDVANPGDQGTGLGLPIVRGLVELHGGEMQLQSKPGEGTTVSVKFPPARLALAKKTAAYA